MPTSLKTDGVHLCYFKLRLFNSLKYLWSTTLGWKDIDIGK